MISPVDAPLAGRHDRPPIAHLPSREMPDHIALCGTEISDVDAPPDVDRCIVCTHLHETEHCA